MTLDLGTFDAFYSPAGSAVRFDTRDVVVTRGEHAVTVRLPLIGPEHIATLAGELRAAQRALADRPIAEIAQVLDQAAAVWLDASSPDRRRLAEAMSVVTGFSVEMVHCAIDLEQRSSRRPDLLGALDRELGDHRALDGFIDTPMGQTTAVGPSLIGGIFSANIPALPHLTVLRAFLVKAACLGRVSRGEPLYLAAYAKTIAALDPVLGQCVAVTWWPSEDHETEAAFLRHIDHVIAYGGDAALSAIRSRAPAGLAATWHGHRLGAAVVLESALSDGVTISALAEKIACDFTIFDQHACLAPQTVYVVAPAGPTASFARALDAAMAAWAERLPPRHLTATDEARLRSAREALVVRQLLGEPVEVITPFDRLQGCVVVEPGGTLSPSPMDRFVRVARVDTAEHVLGALRPVARYLQCVAVAGAADVHTRRLELALARLGVTRLCAPGLMTTPSMRWAHDGMACLGRLVRWCDAERFAPGENAPESSAPY